MKSEQDNKNAQIGPWPLQVIDDYFKQKTYRVYLEEIQLEM